MGFHITPKWLRRKLAQADDSNAGAGGGLIGYQDQARVAQNMAERFHSIYERLAPKYGYETRPETRVFDPQSPNGKLMIAVCLEIIRDTGAQPLHVLYNTRCLEALTKLVTLKTIKDRYEKLPQNAPLGDLAVATVIADYHREYWPNKEKAWVEARAALAEVGINIWP